MRLNTRTWGDGDRTALLLHAICSDSSSWSEVGTALATRGFRAEAVDLRGHGQSPRAKTYEPREFAADVIETSEGRPVDLAIGLSLGGWILGLMVDVLKPRRAVYEDPAWAVDGRFHAEIVSDIERTISSGADQIRREHPRWSPEKVSGELRASELFDPTCMRWLLNGQSYDDSPATPVVPSLVVTADPPDRITPEEAERLIARGFAVMRVPGAGHMVHLDDCEGFMACIDQWMIG